MISIGFLLLIPLIVSGNDGFSKLSDAENNDRLSNCSRFKGFPHGVSKTKDGVFVSFISPRHFVTSLDVLNMTNYNSLDCGTRDNIVTSQLKIQDKFPAKLIGECHNKPTGAILGDAHKMSHNEPQNNYFCIRKEEMKEKEKVMIITSPNEAASGTVVKCKDPKKDVFCVHTGKDIRGFVMLESNDHYELVGTLNGPTTDDNNALEASFLASHMNKFCDTAGICEKRLDTTKVNTTTEAAATSIGNPTTEIQEAETTHASSTPTVPKSLTTESPATKPSSAILVTSPSSTVPTTESNRKVEASTEKSTWDASDFHTTESWHNSTTELPSSAPTSESPTTPVPNLTTREDPPKPRPSLTTTTAKNLITIPPHAEAQDSPNVTEIDCEDENLCFDEDIFSSGIPRRFLLSFASLLVFLLHH